MVFLTSGGMGPECSSVLKRVAHLIADKRSEEYSHVISFIRTKLRFSLLKSTLMAIRGNRGKRWVRNLPTPESDGPGVRSG